MTPPLRFAISKPDINCTWRNFDDTQTIYLTSSSSLNKITLTLANNATAQGSLPKSEPRPYGELAAGTALYVFFNGLLSNEEIATIQWTAQGSVSWKSACFDYKNERYWVLTPTQDIAFGPNTSVAFQLTHVLASTANIGPLSIDLTGAEGLRGLSTSFSPGIQVKAAPVTGNKTLSLNVGFAGGARVYTSETGAVQSNSLCLYLTNPLPEPLVPGGIDSWKQQPTFQLSLVFGDGAGALTRLAEAEAISVNIRNSFGNAWEPVFKQRQGNYPSWLMRPSRNGGGTVLGAGEQATIAFDLTGIVTQLPQGLTYAYLGFSDIPGYNDGYYALEILKVDPVRLRSFIATPSAFNDATGPQTANLAFTVENAGYISISNTGYARSVTEQRLSSSVNVTLQNTTVYTLTATHAITGQPSSQSVTVSVSPDILHITPIGMITLWYGAENKVPAGWALCNGQNGTPDLTGRFVVGASTSASYRAGMTGEGKLYLNINQLPAHSHLASASTGGLHQHSTTYDKRGFNANYSDQGLTPNNPATTKSEFTNYTSNDGQHNHVITVEPTGNGMPIDVVPRYYAVHYIMRVR